MRKRRRKCHQVTGTPAFLINGRLLGGVSIREFKEVIDKELAGTGSDKVTDYSRIFRMQIKRGIRPEAARVSWGRPVSGENRRVCHRYRIF